MASGFNGWRPFFLFKEYRDFGEDFGEFLLKHGFRFRKVLAG